MSLLLPDCNEAMDIFYDDENDIPFYRKLPAKIHLYFCQHCAEEMKQLLICRDLLRSGFIPPSPSFEDRIMEQLPVCTAQNESEAPHDVPGGLSFRTWVIIGFFIFVSLTLSFFGTEFFELASKYGSSLLIPLGITTGIMLTGYGAFFIGSHLKELSDHFKLH